jgi:hypothetical protein
MNTDELLSQIETCERAAWWSLDWEKSRITPNQLLLEGIREGLLSGRSDFNESAGERVVEIASKRELTTDYPGVYDQVIHTASLADVLSHTLRKAAGEPWKLPEPTTIPGGHEWASSVFLAPGGQTLRRVVLVSHWDKDRHYSHCRDWSTIGNICAYELPMQLAICVLGQVRDGKRYGYFSRGYRHPVNKGLRFRKRTDAGSKFKSSWEPIFREDHDEITTADWLSAMHSDGVLADSAFSVTVDVPTKEARQHVLDLAARKLDRLMSLKTVPDEQFTGCNWPVRCPYISPCHGGAPEPNGRYGFVRVDQVGSSNE